ncbi:MAG: hypothetical protein QOE20_5056, partial [Mycobacterium sp.]|nr:hypothetical protein [Mycobacterium sp.]
MKFRKPLMALIAASTALGAVAQTPTPVARAVPA